MVLDRRVVMDVLSSILERVPETNTRLVGTASSMLRGIDIEAGDIDILFRNRADVDVWCRTLPRRTIVDSPSWLEDSAQYFARLDIDAVTVELSTVEIETKSETMECFGSGPWSHFDVLAFGNAAVCAVSSEVRLATEVSRGRTDRWQPIARHLAATSCDLILARQALSDHLVSREVAERVLAFGAGDSRS